jgi:dTDP-4-amino-4,6-dideoxygalactose transaminase
VSTAELAILGGEPAFADPLHVGRPNVGDVDSFLARMRDVLERRRLTNNGPLVQELERRLAERLEVRNCVAMANATVALEIVARALGLEGEVIVPSMTFVATAHAFSWLGIRPVFCDVDAETHTLDPARVEESITSRTSAIVGVHLWGEACDVASLDAIAGRHGLALVFDAAHAFGCAYAGRPIGGHGRAEIMSFHATKFFNTFEGGALTTDDDELAARARLMQNFGFRDYDDVVSVGINGKMSEAAAAMGLTTLDELGSLAALNRTNLDRYRAELSGIAGLRVLEPSRTEHANCQYVVVDVDPGEAGLDRDELLDVLWAENVLARRYFFPGCHRMEPYRTLDPEAGSRLPVTERVVARILQLPTGTAVSPADIARIGSILRAALERPGAVRGALARGAGRRA